MLPNNAYIENTDDFISEFEETEQNKTFGISIGGHATGGIIDEMDALRQTVYLMLSTEADQYIIYPYTYGLKTIDLIGKPMHYVMAVIPERITETLLTDNRITDVSDFEFEVNRNKLNVKFVVHTIYGDSITSGNTTIGDYRNDSTVEISLGEIELALNSIIRLQNSLINGDEE